MDRFKLKNFPDFVRATERPQLVYEMYQRFGIAGMLAAIDLVLLNVTFHAMRPGLGSDRLTCERIFRIPISRKSQTAACKYVGRWDDLLRAFIMMFCENRKIP